MGKWHRHGLFALACRFGQSTALLVPKPVPGSVSFPVQRPQEAAGETREGVCRPVARADALPDCAREGGRGGRVMLGAHHMTLLDAEITRAAVSRAQMRFPTALVKADAAGGWMLGAHHMTLLDGEMLVDEDLATGARTRRFLAYDCIALGGRSLTHKPWKARPQACWGCALLQVGVPPCLHPRVSSLSGWGTHKIQRTVF